MIVFISRLQFFMNDQIWSYDGIDVNRLCQFVSG